MGWSKSMRYIVNFDSAKDKQFYKYEGKLATIPIIRFIDKYSNKYSGKLVDVGCGSKFYINYFTEVDKYIGIDIANDEADIIADAKFLPISADSIAVVLCTQVIEHDPEPQKIIAEIHRILKKGGILILSAPQMGKLHGEPNDYYRYTKWGLKYLLLRNGLDIQVIETQGGFFRAIGSHLNFFILDYFGKNRYVKNALRYTIININNFIFILMDKLMPWEKDTLGYNIIAKKE